MNQNLSIENYRIRIFESKDLQGLTGDNGEKFVVFIRNYKNPLSSEWAWFLTKELAQDFIKSISK